VRGQRNQSLVGAGSQSCGRPVSESPELVPAKDQTLPLRIVPVRVPPACAPDPDEESCTSGVALTDNEDDRAASILK
jgi:hypothetical protein